MKDIFLWFNFFFTCNAITSRLIQFRPEILRIPKIYLFCSTFFYAPISRHTPKKLFFTLQRSENFKICAKRQYILPLFPKKNILTMMQ